MRGRETQGRPARVSSVTFGVSMATASREPVGRATGPPGHLATAGPTLVGGMNPTPREDERMWRPRRVLAGEAQLALELHGGDPGVVDGHQVGRTRPHPQRRAGAVHHRRRRHPTSDARRPGTPTAAAWAAHRPARRRSEDTRTRPASATRRDRRDTRPRRRSALLVLQDAARKSGRGTQAKLRIGPDGANRICGTPLIASTGAAVRPMSRR
jgi:hypothetical protein